MSYPQIYEQLPEKLHREWLKLYAMDDKLQDLLHLLDVRGQLTIKRDMFTFIHTADIHLDSPLRSLALRDSEIANRVGGATRRTLERIVGLSIDEEVDALIIAGDLYDGDLTSMKTAAFLSRQMRRLEEASIAVYLIRGNHDADSSITRHLDLPANVHLFKGSGGSFVLKEAGVALHGVSFKKRQAPKSLLPYYPPPCEGLVNIGIMHTSLAGAEGHDEYAPCALSDLLAHGYDYWALGHIHKREVYAKKPFVVMAGIPQGRDIGEEGSKSVTLAKVTDRAIEIEERFVADIEFRRVAVDLSGISDRQSALKEVERALQKAKSRAKSESAVCRIALTGNSPLYWRLRRDSDLFEEDVKESAKVCGGLYIEGIDNRLDPFTEKRGEADPVQELKALMEGVARESAFRDEAGNFLEEAVGKMPPSLRDRFGGNGGARHEVLGRLLSEGIADVVAALHQ